MRGLTTLLESVVVFFLLFLLSCGCSASQTINVPTTYPKGWVPGSEGWIPPLPQGMAKPRPLSQQEWEKVLEIASTDDLVLKQMKSNNIKDFERYWEGFAGGPGSGSYSDASILDGSARLSSNIIWYYPAIFFHFRSRLSVENRDGQLVGVTMDGSYIIFSEGTGLEPPIKLPR